MGDTTAREQFADDAALLNRAHAGDPAAIAALYDRHAADAHRLATILIGTEDADDLVSEAFTRVLARIRAGPGPVDDFRTYLFATIRNRHRDLLRRGHHEVASSDRPWVFDDTLVDAAVEEYDGTAVEAFRCLPPRWQHILWHLEVEGLSVADLSAQLGLSPTALTSLAARAREGLRTAYLQQRVTGLDRAAECRWVTERLGRYVRGRLSTRGRDRIEEHLRTCAGCAPTVARLAGLNRHLGTAMVRDAS